MDMASFSNAFSLVYIVEYLLGRLIKLIRIAHYALYRLERGGEIEAVAYPFVGNGGIGYEALLTILPSLCISSFLCFGPKDMNIGTLPKS